jgi:dipeptidyl aminopeptidase/acylaminoacyl peptidase
VGDADYGSVPDWLDGAHALNGSGRSIGHQRMLAAFVRGKLTGYTRSSMVRSLLVLTVAGSLVAAAQSPMTAEDAVYVPQASTFVVSPTGADIAVASSEIDWTSNQPKPRWTHLKGKLPFDPDGAANVVWSPDGTRVAFFRTEKGKTTLFATTSARGAIRAICELYTPNAFLAATGNRITWSAKGDLIAFVGTLDPPPTEQDPVVIDRLQYKTRTALSDNRRSRVFVVTAAPYSTPRALTPADRDAHSISWGPGSEIVYLANPGADPDAIHNYDIYAINADSGSTRTVVASPGVEMDPQVSPDGKWIAYRATTRAVTTIDSVAEDTHVWVVPYSGGSPRELNRSLDRRCTLLRWMPDSRALVYLAADRGRILPYRSTLEATTKALLDMNASASNLQVTGNGDSYLTLSEPSKPADLVRLSPSGEVTKLTTFAGDAAKTWKLVEPEAVRFKSFDGTEVEAFLYPPVDRSGKWPMILNIHGGPHGMHGYAFSGSTQYYAARGYAVLAVNPRGSAGYGQKFADGCVNDWGGGDYRDLMAAVDEILRRYPQVDANRLGVMGSSYGGYMTNWIVSQTGRFRAAVAMASLSNLISFYATSLYQDLVHAEFSGFPWTGNNFETLWKRSPLAHVKNVRTPVLLVHGERDNDVHITQAEEMYTALRQRNVPVSLVRYPREGHGMREPKHQLDVLRRAADWMDRYLK